MQVQLDSNSLCSEAPATNARGIKKKNEQVTVERKKKDSEKATLLVLLDLSSIFLPLNRGGFYIVFCRYK